MRSPQKNRPRSNYRLLLLALLAALVTLSQGCASLGHYNALPENLEDQAQIPGLPDVRDWADAPSKVLLKSGIKSIEQERAANHGKLEPVVYGLALSGGGGDGAFGAGLLCGWTEAGTRPTFKIVTGISTGALISPFAFLGPAYDHRLKEAYTTISDKDIYTGHDPLAILLSVANVRPLPSMASTKPLAKLLEKLIDARDAGGYRRGIPQGPASDCRHHPTRRPTSGDLGYDRHRGQQLSAQTGIVPPYSDSFRLHSRRLFHLNILPWSRAGKNFRKCTVTAEWRRKS